MALFLCLNSAICSHRRKKPSKLKCGRLLTSPCHFPSLRTLTFSIKYLIWKQTSFQNGHFQAYDQHSRYKTSSWCGSKYGAGMRFSAHATKPHHLSLAFWAHENQDIDVSVVIFKNCRFLFRTIPVAMCVCSENNWCRPEKIDLSLEHHCYFKILIKSSQLEFSALADSRHVKQVPSLATWCADAASLHQLLRKLYV